MDVERGRKGELSFGSVTDQIKEKANHPTVSGTLIILLILDIAMLVVGIIKKNECPVEDRIPIYLIVAGAVGIVSKILPFINRKLEFTLVTYVIYLLYLFEIVWAVVGSVWVYKIYQPNYNELLPLHCNRELYLFTFWILTIRWILVALSFVLGCCYCCFSVNK
ncbi:hypothetical protein ILUMI_00797 [Ignelater luminosus]|uniref:Uncharacterized protein n=1 Tax=Ignelater luminosus TaxID=2038154 RepID=A0A8K0DGJ5_IGNLU|nr:hypothetical protein ILUMI_00797 [Ignelater luminosus]